MKDKPVVVDLLEMYRFFCPDKDVPCTEETIMQLVTKRRGATVFRLRSGLEAVLHAVLKSILATQEQDSGVEISHVYGFLSRAIEAFNAPEDMDAVCRAAAVAHSVRWDAGQATLRLQ